VGADRKTAQRHRQGLQAPGSAGGGLGGRRVSNVLIASAAEALPTLNVAQASNVGPAVERVPSIRR
jgi:hypothetical protein